MKINSFIAGLMAGAATAGAVSAQSTAECTNPEMTEQFNECAWEAFIRADQDLETAFLMALEGARQIDDIFPDGPATAEAQIYYSQQDFYNYRDSKCAADALPYQDADLYSAVHSFCLEAMTRRRDEDLRIVWEAN